MADTKTQSGLSTPAKLQVPQKPLSAPKPAPVPGRVENKRVINRLIDFFETKA